MCILYIIFYMYIYYILYIFAVHLEHVVARSHLEICCVCVSTHIFMYMFVLTLLKIYSKKIIASLIKQEMQFFRVFVFQLCVLVK